MLGLLGVAFGLWWADALAALFISFAIVRDGVRELRTALGDVMDRRPEDVVENVPDPLPREPCDDLRSEDGIEDVRVRVREVGRKFSAEAFVIPADGADVVARI